ncbi:hypothetical protein, conserved [Trypanosoma brucei gambiense DAL972]|uniref:Treble clef zinc finger domain-containing protein n=2 Tax=Trypanosoma brucei TaxID=5691 RepID=C9ZLH2_TRYB9|nr:hypothetical protein, conserved [Trypanosoma brucei gambiense DAL972]RHW73661.1 hypothetical protein DPX39_030046700 [Trypanosoma brucei equiperdum]CBH10181.1 hypothetical protein, conserved [Trypanosoma brucei gambiense DAL972]|eukprot:XP_011772471.1 hypothetical protein, conserved [Trypanosoma brucei gambiense DAL972]
MLRQLLHQPRFVVWPALALRCVMNVGVVTRPHATIALFTSVRFATTGAGAAEVKQQRRKKKSDAAGSESTRNTSVEGKRKTRRGGAASKAVGNDENKGDGFDADDIRGDSTKPWEEEEEEGFPLVEADDVLNGADGISPRGHRRAVESVVADEYDAAEEPEDDEVAASAGDTAADGVDEIAPTDGESRYLKDRFPDLVAEYDEDTNEEPAGEVLVDSARVVSWKCVECGFKWKSGVFVRTCLRTKCPQCEQIRNPRLTARFVQLWDQSLNDPCVDPKTVAASSNKSAYWRCSNCNTSFKARIKDMVSDKAKCPSCSMLNLDADFSKYENGLLQEWHPLKNGDLQPGQVEPTDQTKLWWLCMACGHEWEATLAARLSKSRRTKGKDCPVCHGKGKS